MRNEKYLIIGLGNPGEKYQKTRHNFGKMVAEKLLTTDLPPGLIVKTLGCFMNESGGEAIRILNYQKIKPENLIVIHDDLDLPFGEIKVAFDSSSAGHKGVQNIIDTLKTQKFWRVRMGIGKSETVPAEKYVLENFTKEEQEKLPAIIDKAVSLLLQSNLLNRLQDKLVICKS